MELYNNPLIVPFAIFGQQEVNYYFPKAKQVNRKDSQYNCQKKKGPILKDKQFNGEKKRGVDRRTDNTMVKIQKCN